MFFSRITLEDKIGTEYEPYIYAALYSSKVMLTICSSKENIEAVWVKNEWSRFLGFRQNDNSKTLLPLYFGMDKAELPEEFALLSAYDIHTDGFEDELLRGIKKLIPLPIMKAKRRKQILKATGIAAACLVLVLGVVAAIIIPKKLEEKRLAEEIAANEAAYQSAIALFDNADYTAAEAAFVALGDYKDSAHMAARCPIQPEYDAAMQLYYDGKYAQATWAFEALGDYEDATEQKENAELSWRKSLAQVICGPDERFDSEGNRYVNALGIVSSDSSPTVAEPNEHGKIIAVANHGGAILYEDGALFIGGETVAQDVVQIDDLAMLKADGTVWPLWYDSTNSEENAYAAWTDIVMLAGDSYHYLAETNYDVLLGVDVSGNV